jgi:hypothetical protein
MRRAQPVEKVINGAALCKVLIERVSKPGKEKALEEPMPCSRPLALVACAILDERAVA